MSWEGIDRWLGTPHEREMMCLTWQELRELDDAGWEIGSHTASHPHLPELDASTLERELVDSKRRIEAELDRPCTSLAYPYGSVDERVVQATRNAGYLAAGTIPRILARPSPLLWPRAAIFHNDDMYRFRLKVSPLARRLRSGRLGVAFDRARVALADRP